MFIRFVALLSLLIAISSPAQSAPFLLHDGDTVVFYGDSITEQRLYTVYVAAAVHTQHPTWHIRFYNAGVGGDRVTGGGAGPVDTRLTRDVIARHPTVVAIMLGMNDRATPETRAAYAPGYEHILTRLRTEVPGVRLSIIAPSPFDQITRPGDHSNDTLAGFTAIDKSLADKIPCQLRRSEYTLNRRPRPCQRSRSHCGKARPAGSCPPNGRIPLAHG